MVTMVVTMVTVLKCLLVHPPTFSFFLAKILDNFLATHTKKGLLHSLSSTKEPDRISLFRVLYAVISPSIFSLLPPFFSPPFPFWILLDFFFFFDWFVVLLHYAEMSECVYSRFGTETKDSKETKKGISTYFVCKFVYPRFSILLIQAKIKCFPVAFK